MIMLGGQKDFDAPIRTASTSKNWLTSLLIGGLFPTMVLATEPTYTAAWIWAVLKDGCAANEINDAQCHCAMNVVIKQASAEAMAAVALGMVLRDDDAADILKDIGEDAAFKAGEQFSTAVHTTCRSAPESVEAATASGQAIGSLAQEMVTTGNQTPSTAIADCTFEFADGTRMLAHMVDPSPDRSGIDQPIGLILTWPVLDNAGDQKNVVAHCAPETLNRSEPVCPAAFQSFDFFDDSDAPTDRQGQGIGRALMTMAAWVHIVDTDPDLPECAVEAPTPEQLKVCKSAYSMKVRQYRSSYQGWSTEHRASAFLWQRYTTVVSFLLIITIIVVGMYLAILEFRKGRSGVTTLKFGADGVEISSEIIGLIVLTLSLAFTYIYIDRIYPVNERPAVSQSQQAGGGGK